MLASDMEYEQDRFYSGKDHTLSIINEETEERSRLSRSSHYSEPVAIPETSRYSENYYSVAHVQHASIFSSETSYGEPLPPGQSTFKSLGLGLSVAQVYEKSLPSLPKGSMTKSISARSAPKTESGRGSVAKSGSSRHSVVKSESSRESLVKPESSRHSAARSESSRHSAAQSESSRHSAARFESVRPDSEVLAPDSMPPMPPPKSSSLSSLSSVSTHSSSTPSSPSSQSTLRTYDDVLDEVASSLAVRTKMRAETMATSERTKIGVCTTMSRTDDHRFIRILADKLHSAMALHSSYLFALMPSLVGGPLDTPATLVFCGAPQQLVTKASILAGLRFKSRLAELEDASCTWIGQLEGRPAARENWDLHMHDEDVLWDVVRKAANPVDPSEPPPGSRGIAQMLAEARARLDRLSPREAFTEAMQDGILVDIRPAAQRAEHGIISGSIMIERNVLEWRFDPRCMDGRLPIADRYDLRIIVYCQEGYTSSLAAAALQDIGLWRATDLNGGFARWKNEGFPTKVITNDVDSVVSVSP